MKNTKGYLVPTLMTIFQRVKTTSKELERKELKEDLILLLLMTA